MEFPSVSDSGIKLPIQAKAIAFDLDGTLLDYDGRLSEAVARSVRLISRSGIKVFIISGRLQGGCVKYWRDLGLDTPIAGCNGAYVGFPGREPFLHHRLSETARDIIMDIEDRLGIYTNYYIDNHVYTLHDSPEREMYSRHYSIVERAADQDEIRNRPLPTKCLSITTEAEQPKLMNMFREALAGHATVTRSNEQFIEMISPEVNKAVGLKALAEWSGIPVDKFIAVGDAMNDLPMLESAGFAITFKSGDPGLADHVDMILPPLWEDGIDILAKCILGMTNSGRFLTSRSTRFFKEQGNDGQTDR